MKATYGVTGIMEWVALIPTRQNLVKVRFRGGSLSGYGVTPATFTTENPVIMRMIEESSYFRRGKIRLLRKEGKSEEESVTFQEREKENEKEKERSVIIKKR